MICLDTNVVIGATNGRSPKVAVRLDAELGRGTRLLIPVVVLYELRYGIARSERPERNAAILDAFLAGPFEIVSFDAEDAGEAGLIRARLERSGTPIGHYDTLIAAQARRRGGLLATSNGREFTRVPGLTVQDWAA